MTAIGFVTRTIYGGFRGQLKFLPICADIDIVPNRDKSGDNSSDFRIFTQGLEVGSGRILTGEGRGTDYRQPVTCSTWPRRPQALCQPWSNGWPLR